MTQCLCLPIHHQGCIVRIDTIKTLGHWGKFANPNFGFSQIHAKFNNAKTGESATRTSI